MISFRKHAAESTRRPNSFLGRGLRVASAAPPLALLTLIIVAAASGAAASPRAQQQDKARQQETQAGTKGAEPAAESPTRSEGKAEPVEEAKIPIRVTRVETADGPGVLATIGEFPSDLNEAGQEFLKREFFEHFASDVLGLGDSDSSTRAMLKVAMLPQDKENQREGDFTFGKLSGHMVVLVEKRRVLVACTFSEAERKPQLLAAVRRLWAGVGV